MMHSPVFSSSGYWEARYRAGGHSGAGSYGRLAAFKAGFVNGFISANGINSVLDLGCGDGNFLSLLELPDYLGVDVSPTVLAACATRFRHRQNARFMLFSELVDTAELALSLDVIYHLIEDDCFAAYMDVLFTHAERYVLVYASNLDRDWPSPHVRHRRFSDHVTSHYPEWRLLAHVPNCHAYDPSRPDDTSFADFFIYGRIGASCVLTIPAG